MKNIIAIDPGVNGGIAWTQAGVGSCMKVPEIGSIMEHFKATVPFLCFDVCYIEQVASRPAQGVCSVFTFGKVYGRLIESAYNASERVVFVTPQTWQKAIGYDGKGKPQPQRKKELKELAEQAKQANQKITMWNADALLILKYAMEKENN